MLAKTSTVPLLLAALIGGLIGVSEVIWSAHKDVEGFEAAEYREMERSAVETGQYIQDFVEQRKVLVEAFAQHHAEMLATIVANPYDDILQESLADQVTAFFPKHLAFTARRSDGEFVPDDLGEFVGDACRADMDAFAARLANGSGDDGHGVHGPEDHARHAYDPFIHPQPFNYHFDISAGWKSAGGIKGLLMISFPPEALVAMLRGRELPEHQLLLLRRDIPDLIEVTATGSREKIDRDGRLSVSESEMLTARYPIGGTRWDVAYLPSAAFLTGYRNETYFAAGFISVLILLFMAILAFWYSVCERARKETEAQKAELLQQSNRDRTSLQTLIDVIPMPIFRRNGQGRLDLINEAYAGLLGMPAGDLMGKTMSEIYGTDAASDIADKDQQLLCGAASRQVYERHMRPLNGSAGRDVIFYKSSMTLDGDDEASIVGAAVDVTEEKALRKELEKLATTDPLTGLANRRLFMDTATAEILRAGRYGTGLSLVMLDIDHFKLVNDTYGHDAGDEAIKAVSDILAAKARQKLDLPSRLGGEEFATLLPSTGINEAYIFAERVRKAIEGTSIRHKDKEFQLTVSLGVAEFSEDEGLCSLDDLMAASDQALYKAKQSGRNRTERHTMQDYLAHLSDELGAQA